MGWKRRAASAVLAVGALIGAGAVLVARRPDRPILIHPVAGRLMLTGVTVVDPRSGTLTPGMTILMNAGRIVSVSARDPLPTDTAIEQVDGSGRYVVPGYNDMHAHPLGPDDPSGTLALMLANGITGFRQMHGSPEMLAERRGSRLPLGKDSPAALVLPGSLLTPFNAGSAKEAVAAVREQKAAGADFIKLGLASPAAFFAALSEARRVGLPLAGHLQRGVDAAAAAKAGMKAIEHLGPGDTLLVSCSTDEAKLREAIAKRPPVKAPPVKFPFMEQIFVGFIQKRIVNPAAHADAVDVARLGWIARTFSEDKCRALAATFHANGTWIVPTLVRLRTTELGDRPEYANDPNLRYMPPETVQSWRDATGLFTKNQTTTTKATYRIAFELQLRLTRLLDEAGVRMLAGSDDSGQWEVPGFSLHQEFDELAKAGLPPLRILQMTTSDPADFLGRATTMGSVAAGHNADLVILAGDPIRDVANLHRIVGVVRAGFFYDQSKLAALKRRVEAGQGYLR